jgi:hypothetical protein
VLPEVCNFICRDLDIFYNHRATYPDKFEETDRQNEKARRSNLIADWLKPFSFDQSGHLYFKPKDLSMG